jgi:hypothetical protein
MLRAASHVPAGGRPAAAIAAAAAAGQAGGMSETAAPPGPVRDTAAMLAGMAPVRRPGSYVFVTVPAADGELAALALGSFREDEGLSLILPAAAAAARGLPADLPMACLTLTLWSALDGVGLTAAVAAALAAAGIPANVVAASRHDHVFVPEAMAGRALDVLERLAAGAGHG